MKFTQKNPLPVPSSGALQSIPSPCDTRFDWRYALEDARLLNLYEKGKNATWNASDLDWSIEVDVPKMSIEGDSRGMLNNVLKCPKTLSTEEAIELRTHMDAFTLSQFLHGEQGALMAAAKIVQTVPWEEAKFYAANQVADEARHVEVYHRYLTEKWGVSYPIHPALQRLLTDIVQDSRWDITYLGMQILVEGLALAAFGMMRITMPREPLIQSIVQNVMADEARHVGFGVLTLEKLYTEELSSAEIGEREEFVIEATRLMHGQILQGPVFERLGFDVDTWLTWQHQNPMHRGFRQMMFSKIVPNLKRLGLLTPRVREALAELDVLRFEHEKDSVAEPGVVMSAEVMALMAQHASAKEEQPPPRPPLDDPSFTD